ncbi:MAG: HDOD domain-containing protein [Gemmatimonadota bacterium]|nr:HDOD domain-containing protein [Gemmatimonadota bacterium]
MSQRAHALVQGHSTVASPPVVYQKLMEAINDVHTGPVGIARIIDSDPGLTARLLRVVNSSFFGFPRRIQTVQHAVRAVGSVQITDLALATSVISLFDGIPYEWVDMTSFWRHSLAVGVISRSIALRRGERNVEEFFVSGLLHDIGRIILLSHAGQDGIRTMEAHKRNGVPLHEAEHDLLECDHGQVGEALLTRWNFPGEYVEAAAYHHRPHLATNFPTHAATVHVADIMAHGMAWGTSGQTNVPPLSTEAWELVQIEPDGIPPMVRHAHEQLVAAMELVSTPVE